MPGAIAELLKLDRPGVAGVIGAVAALLGFGLTAGLDIGDGTRAVAIALLTAMLFVVLLVARNAVGLWLAPD